MTTEATMRAYLDMLRAAREIVRMHAQEFTPHVDPLAVQTIVRATGEVLSINAALDELDRLESRAAVEH